MNIIPTLVNSSGDDEEGANWIISYYAKKYELQFIKVSQELGFNIKSKKMGASTAAAMWVESNISVNSQRIILRYMRNEFGTSLVVPAHQIAAFGENHVPPECGSILTDDKKKIHYWTKPIEVVVQKSMSVFLTQQQELEIEKRITPATIDIVYGGDHGQGKFRAVVKIIFRDVHDKNAASIVLKVGHIDCKKIRMVY